MGRTIYILLTNNVFNLNRLHGNVTIIRVAHDIRNLLLNTVVGHSLGGQMAGYIGSWTYALSGTRVKLKRITALDPAKPMFYTGLTFLPTHINFNDAEVNFKFT